MKRDRDLELNKGGASRGQEVEGGVEGNTVGVHMVSRRHSWAEPDREERIASSSQPCLLRLLPITLDSHGLEPTGPRHHIPCCNTATGHLPQSPSSPGCFCILDCSCPCHRLSWRFCQAGFLVANLGFFLVSRGHLMESGYKSDFALTLPT